MAIAFNATTDGDKSTAATSHTFSHTVGSGSDRYLIVSVAITTTRDRIAGVTYNGVRMQRINTHGRGPGRVYLYGLKNPDSGAHDVVITTDGTSLTIIGNAADYTGVKQSYSLDNANSQYNSGISSGSWNGTSVVTRHTDCWGIMASLKTAGGTPNAGGGSTFRAGGDGHALFDSNGALGAPASESMNAYLSDGTQDWVHCMATLIEAGATLVNSPRVVDVFVSENITVPSGLTNRLLVVCIGTHQGNITAVSFNGDSLTKIAEGSSSFDEDGSIWVLVNPDEATAALSISMSGGSWNDFTAFVLENAKQTTTITNAATGGNSSSPSQALTPSSDENLIFAAIGAEDLTRPAGDAIGAANISGQDYEDMGAEYFIQRTAASKTMSFTLASGQRWGIAVAAIEPAPAAATANDERSATLTGKDTSNSERAARLTGGDGATDERAATIHGTDTTNSERSAVITGKETANDERGARLTGNTQANAERGAVVTGKDTANSERSAHLEGTSITSAERDAKLTGTLAANAERGARLTGQQSLDIDLVDIEFGGVPFAVNDERGVKITGKDTATDERAAVITGTATANSERGATVKGSLDSNDERGARLTGLGLINDERTAKIHGQMATAAEVNAHMWGKDTAFDERGGKLHGIAVIFSERGARLTGRSERAGRSIVLPPGRSATVL